MKRVRILLRVSSNQQLDADGDLAVQRDIVRDYIFEHKDWQLDDKEYFEGARSGYKTSIQNRDILEEVASDAKKQEFDILVVYKDDRLGRRMWEIGAYVMQLKSLGVDVYTTKDDCISPESNDIMGQMVLALRYGAAQKSSADTGQRVKDTLQKLVKNGKFTGGRAPYGYEMVLSGEISKHGRALHKLQIVPERMETVKYIYNLSYNKEFGSSKIAKILNESDRYRKTAPNDYWKSGTVTSILTNPIYCGITAYKRREKINGRYKSLNSDEWIYADEVNNEIAVFDKSFWDKVQQKRKNRSFRYKEKIKDERINILTRNNGELVLIDVIYCGYCGTKLTNGSKYNYWTIKSTGEKKSSKTLIYKCPSVWSGVTVSHIGSGSFKADKIEKIVLDIITGYIIKLQKESHIYEKIIQKTVNAKKIYQDKIRKEKQELDKIIKDIDILKSHIPDAMNGDYPLSIELIAETIESYKQKQLEKTERLKIMESEYRDITTYNDSKKLQEIYEKIPVWDEVFSRADKHTKRVLVNKIIDRIMITNGEIVIRFRIEV